MKALFTPHLLHFSQLCPHFLPWFNSNGITCSETFGKAFHSLPGVSLSHSSLWQLSDTHYRAHSYKAFIQLVRTVAGKRLEAAQIPAATTCCIITLHGNESKRQPVPRMGLGGSGAGKQIPSSEAFHTQRMTWEHSPAQPRATEPPWPWQHPAAAVTVGFVSPVVPVMNSPMVVPHTGLPVAYSRATGWSLLTEMDPCGQQRLKYHTCGKFRLRQEQTCK